MSCAEKQSWKPLTPASDPAGARISAGKSGSVLTSLPNTADALVNCVPASCMPSPESPQKRTTTVSSCSTFLPLRPSGACVSIVAISRSLLGSKTRPPRESCRRTQKIQSIGRFNVLEVSGGSRPLTVLCGELIVRGLVVNSGRKMLDEEVHERLHIDNGGRHAG